MTDILKGCTVAFDRDIREDDAEDILNAIRMIKGVMCVDPSRTTRQDWIAAERVRREMCANVMAVLYPKEEI